VASSRRRDAAARQRTPTIPHSAPSTRATRRPAASRLRRALSFLGPGLVTGASDDDPSGIGTYATAGASLGFATLWTAIVTLPLMFAVQFICAKIGMVSGKGLAGVLRKYYPRSVLYAAITLLVAANTINAGTDIAAIAAALHLVLPIPPQASIVPIAAAIVAMQIWGSYRRIAQLFKWLTLTLFAYIGATFLAKPHWGEVVRATLVPRLSADPSYLTTLVAILGTTISPYLFFWQASQEVEEEVQEGRTALRDRRGATKSELRLAAADTAIGMLLSNLVMYFVILATAATLHASGKTDVSSAADAARALEPLAGSAAKYLFAVGLIGAGLLAVPVLTGSSAYAVAETFGWKYGLDTKPREATQFYAVIAVSTLVGISIDFVGINPIRALFWTAVINGILAVPLLVLVMLVANDPAIMGRRKNGSVLNAAGWLTAAAMLAAAVAMGASALG